MAAGDQKRDRLGRFADEGKGAATDMQLCARARKRLIRLELRWSEENDRHGLKVAAFDDERQELLADINEICS
jgi:hypothetical protein